MAEEPAQPTPQPKSNKATKIIIFLVVAVVVLAGGLWLKAYFSGFESTDDAQIDGHINAISPRVTGTVLQVNIQDNQTVQAGMVLVKIDPRDYEVALAKAQADLADAVATAKAVENDVPITQSTTTNTLSNTRAGEVDAQRGVAAAERSLEAASARVDAARARVLEAQANADKAMKDQARLKQLVDKDEISKQQYDAAVATAAATAAAVQTAQSGIKEAEDNVKFARAQIEQNQARVQQASAQVQTALTGPQQLQAARSRYEAAQARILQQRAAVEQAQLNLSYTTITAPVTGIVGKKSVEVGQTVSAGQQLMAIVPTDDVWITANFKESQLKEMKPGQRVKISVDAYGRDYEGHVESIAAASGARYSLLPPENATGNYVKVVQRIPVRIRLEHGQDAEHLMRPGMSVVPKVYLH